MKNLAAAIPVVNATPILDQWQVLRAVDHDDVTPPWMEIIVQVLGKGAIYPQSGTTYTLVAVDSGESLCLDVNPNPVCFTDQVYTISKKLDKTPYTILSEAAKGTTIDPTGTPVKPAPVEPTNTTGMSVEQAVTAIQALDADKKSLTEKLVAIKEVSKLTVEDACLITGLVSMAFDGTTAEAKHAPAQIQDPNPVVK